MDAADEAVAMCKYYSMIAISNRVVRIVERQRVTSSRCDCNSSIASGTSLVPSSLPPSLLSSKWCFIPNSAVRFVRQFANSHGLMVAVDYVIFWDTNHHLLASVVVCPHNLREREREPHRGCLRMVRMLLFFFTNNTVEEDRFNVIIIIILRNSWLLRDDVLQSSDESNFSNIIRLAIFFF